MSKKGFTILEILVVLTVLALLVGIAVPRIKGMQDQARIMKVKAELKTIKNAVEHYYINKKPNVFPQGASTLTADLIADTSIPQVLEGVMYDPFMTPTKEYHYALSTSRQYYVISSVGVDGVNGKVVVDDNGLVTMTKSADDICITNGSGC